jgi:hypothetical protein
MRHSIQSAWFPFFQLFVGAAWISACGGRVDHPPGRRTPPPNTGERDASTFDDGGASDAAANDASEPADASNDGSPLDAGDRDATSDADVCPSGAVLSIAGDYVASDKTEYWLRKTATATTYTVVPAGAPTPSALPQLYRVSSICPHWLSLSNTDGTFARLDWTESESSLRICVRSVPDLNEARKLPNPDAADTATGCAGAPWTELVRSTP